MSLTLEDLATQIRGVLRADPGPAGRKQVCAIVEEAVKDRAFIAQHFGPDTSQRDILFEDKELGFCICAHVYREARDGQPHDHGSSWAIYGQAEGETVMNDWTIVEPAGEGKMGKVRFARSYALKPGMAHLYNEGDLHSPKREAAGKLLRIEGTNLDKVRRFGYRAA